MLAGPTPQAQASHFRFGHLTWVARPDLGPNTVEFTFTQGWRRTSCGGSAFDGFVAVGDFGCPVGFDAGDGNFPALTGSVISIDPANDWYLAQYKAIHTYASPNNGGSPWVANWSSCCRIYAPQQNAPGTSFRGEALVDLAIVNSSPLSTLVPVVPFLVNSVNNLALPVADVNGDTLACRLATPGESLIGIQPGPPVDGSTSALTISPGCVITWNTAGTAVGQLWAVQIVIEESRGGNPAHGRVALEFLIEIVSSIPNTNPPQCDSPPTPTGVVNASVGVPYVATIQGSDPDLGDTLTLNTGGLPAGAVAVPGLPTASLSPVSSTISWTPTLLQVGPHPVLFTVTDQTGQQAVCSFVINVQSGPCGNGILDPNEDCDPPASLTCGSVGGAFLPCLSDCTCGECLDNSHCNDGNSCTADACVNNLCVNTPLVNLPPELPGPDWGPDACVDMEDNDCDGLVDCADPDCGGGATAACQGGTQNKKSCSTEALQLACENGGGVCTCAPIIKDPSTVRFSEPLDIFKSHGRIISVESIDVGNSPVGWVLSNQSGIIYRGVLQAGDFDSNNTGTTFIYRDPGARLGLGRRDGIYKAKIRVSRGGESYGYKIIAYGDLSAATTPDMTLQFYIGQPAKAFIHDKPWIEKSWGWKASPLEE